MKNNAFDFGAVGDAGRTKYRITKDAITRTKSNSLSVNEENDRPVEAFESFGIDGFMLRSSGIMVEITEPERKSKH